MFVVHESGRRWVLVQEEDMEGRLDARLSRLSDQEEEMQKLWREFCNTIPLRKEKTPNARGLTFRFGTAPT